jgi:hypothetical protein
MHVEVPFPDCWGFTELGGGVGRVGGFFSGVSHACATEACSARSGLGPEHPC